MPVVQQRSCAAQGAGGAEVTLLDALLLVGVAALVYHVWYRREE